jgi:hypothetical protein
VPPDSVRCTRVDQLELANFGNLGKPLRYNSPDCPVCQRSNGYFAPTVICKGTVKANSVRLRAQKSEQAPEGVPDSEHNLSSAPLDCPVAQLSETPTVGTQWPGDVAGTPDSVRWRIGLSGAPYDRSLHQRPYWWLGL